MGDYTGFRVQGMLSQDADHAAHEHELERAAEEHRQTEGSRRGRTRWWRRLFRRRTSSG
jgi:hypothetical protein